MPNEKFLQRSFLKIYGLFGILKCQQAPILTHQRNPPTTHVCGLLVFMLCTKVAFAFVELWGLMQVCE